MIRTVPDTGNDEIQLYMRTYYSLLRTTDAIKLQTLVESHAAADSALHVHAGDSQIDISSLVYCSLRVPTVICQTELVVLRQLEEDFARAGFDGVERWERVHAPGRRRRTHFDGEKTLAVMIASRSDIDDIIPILTALQIEWNKVHMALQLDPEAKNVLRSKNDRGTVDAGTLIYLAKILNTDVTEISRLQVAWGNDFLHYFKAMANRKMDLGLQLLAGSQINYRKAASRWWGNLNRKFETFSQEMLQSRPVYFVSSNTHAIPNLISGYTKSIQDDLVKFMEQLSNADLLAEWRALQQENQSSTAKNLENFFYYILKKYQTKNAHAIDEMIKAEQDIGLLRIPAEHGFDIEAQIIQVSKLDKQALDSRLCWGIDVEALAHSDALIVNIDYPLGLSAFELLTRVVEGCDQVLGIYVMGKAATLNGRIGDVMLVNVVHDEHSKNTYLFDNCFQASQISPYLSYGTMLDNQKAITARGTFLQNRTYMDVFYQEGYTVLEMEAGPYLSAVYEMIRPVRHPYDEIINLYSAPFDVGFIHYASDTPYSKGKNLGAGSLGYQGVDATYASAVAIMRRIFQQEAARVRRFDLIEIEEKSEHALSASTAN